MGPLVTPRTREMAAVLASGPGAVVSHRSAASLWELLPAPDSSVSVDITVRDRNRPRSQGIRGHRTSSLGPGDVTKVDGVPVTTPARTILDLAVAVARPDLVGGKVPAWRGPAGSRNVAPAVGHRDVERAVAAANRQNLVVPGDLLAALDRRPDRPGAPILQAVLRQSRNPTFVRSEAEERFLALVKGAQLPEPRVNVRLHGHEVDFLWPSEQVVVEVDGFEFHSSRRRFEGDRRRDMELVASGFRVVRVTWSQMEKEPLAVVARISTVLTAAGSRRSE